MLSFRDANGGRMLSAVVAKALALKIAERKGMDSQEMVGIIRRMAEDEDAREAFFDITNIEVFT